MSSRPLLLATLLVVTSPDALANDQATLQALAERLLALEQRLGVDAPESSDNLAALAQRLAILERRLELQAEESETRTASAPVIAVGGRGVSVKNAKGDVDFRVRGGVQLDQRLFLGDDEVPFNDSLLFRRVRPTLEGNIGPLLAFRITPEFAGDGASLIDAWIDVRFNPAYTLRVGKLKGPIGLERLQGLHALALMERGFPTELAPSRDIGAQLQGDLSGGRVSYALGVFNGAPDGRDSPAANADDNYELQGRVFFEPWKNAANGLSGLGFGIAASSGDKEGGGNALLPRYRSPGQNVFFNYRGTVVADGRHRRLTPQAYYYRGPLGVQAEHIRSSQEVAIGGATPARAELAHRAWQLTAGWVLTGEDASYRDTPRPNRPFVAGGDGWGAFEVVGRYGRLDIDDDAFPFFASVDSAAERASAWGIGLNWYLSNNLKLAFNHTHARFDGGAAGGADREDEKTFFSRVQVAF